MTSSGTSRPMPPCGWCGCAASGPADVVDAIVIATAVRYQVSIVTSDPWDLNHIADSIVERPLT